MSWKRLISRRLPLDDPDEIESLTHNNKGPSSSKVIKERKTCAIRLKPHSLEEWIFAEEEDKGGGRTVEEAVLQYVRNSDDTDIRYEPFPPKVPVDLSKLEASIQGILSRFPLRYLNNRFGSTAVWKEGVHTRVDKSLALAMELHAEQKQQTNPSNAPVGQQGSSSSGGESILKGFALMAVSPGNIEQDMLCSSSSSCSEYPEVLRGQSSFVVIGEVKLADKLSYVEAGVRRVGNHAKTSHTSLSDLPLCFLV